MAGLNTQLGYKAPAVKPASPYALPQTPRPSSGVTRALAGIQPPPAAPSYSDPGSIFAAPTLPTVQAQAPAGTPSTYAPQTPQAPQAPAGFSFDLSTDPILQQMQASAAKQRTEADSSALAQQKQLAIQYGDQGYGSSIDANTGQAAAQNPFSVTANLANQYQTGTHNLDESLNQHNLFYSGERINQLAQALKDYQGQQAGAAGAFQTGLGNINQNHVAALMGADQSVQGAYTDAYNRALALALANGTGAAPTPAATDFSVFGPNTPGQPQTGSGMIGAGSTPIASVPAQQGITVPNLSGPGTTSSYGLQGTRGLYGAQQQGAPDAILRYLTGQAG